ncbi:MAG: hypothetical protein GEV04_20345 [Actinophytocola sp.]|nr:hypothetical protein [Actinophytocola sp.]
MPQAAACSDVAIACGAATTINQYLAAGLIDELRVHIAPVFLGASEARLVAPCIAAIRTPSATKSRPSRTASASMARWSLMPSTRTTVRGVVAAAR